MSQPKIKLGIMLSFGSLMLLGMMPVIANSRPSPLDALNFALYLSIWQLICSLPLLGVELRSNNRGIFAAEIPRAFKFRTVKIILTTGLIFGFSTYLYVLAIEKAGTVSAAIAIQAYPLFAILWETVFLNRRKSPAEIFFVLCLIMSLYYLSTSGTWLIDGFSAWFFVALGVPFLWSIAHVVIKEVLNRTKITPAQVTFFRVSISSVALLIFALVINGVESVYSGMLDLNYQRFAFCMGFVYYLELIVWFYAVKHIDVSIASSITTPWPVITMILAALFLSERIMGYQMFAMLFVIISIYGLLYAGKRKRDAVIA